MDTVREKQFLNAYDAYADAIFRHCFFRVGKDRERARDLTQDTFMKTWEYMEKGNEVKNIRALLYRIANNAIIDWYRKKKETSLDEMRDAGFEPMHDNTNRMLEKLDNGWLLELLEQLDEPYRMVVQMRYLDELGPQEIAEILDETENTISVRIHRGIKKLQDMIALLEKEHGKKL